MFAQNVADKTIPATHTAAKKKYFHLKIIQLKTKKAIGTIHALELSTLCLSASSQLKGTL
jgi:hypothetical protein